MRLTKEDKMTVECELHDSEHIIQLKKITPRLQEALRFANLFETSPHDTGPRANIF